MPYKQFAPLEQKIKLVVGALFGNKKFIYIHLVPKISKI